MLWLIARVASAARRAGKPLSVCGEIAGDVGALLLALGIRELSMLPARIPAARTVVENADCTRLQVVIPRLLRAASRAEIEALLSTLQQP